MFRFQSSRQIIVIYVFVKNALSLLVICSHVTTVSLTCQFSYFTNVDGANSIVVKAQAYEFIIFH